MSSQPTNSEKRTADVHVRLTAKHYDEIYKAAHQRGVTVPEYIRQQLQTGRRMRRDQSG